MLSGTAEGFKAEAGEDPTAYHCSARAKGQAAERSLQRLRRAAGMKERLQRPGGGGLATYPRA